MDTKASLHYFCFTGGLTCRGVLQTTPSHTVSTFISLASPQAGQFGGMYLEYNTTGQPICVDINYLLHIIVYVQCHVCAFFLDCLCIRKMLFSNSCKTENKCIATYNYYTCTETDFLKWLIPDFATNNIYK